MLVVIAIVALGVLIYFKNKVDNRRVDRINRLAEKQEELLQMLKEKNKKELDDTKAGEITNAD